MKIKIFITLLFITILSIGTNAEVIRGDFYLKYNGREYYYLRDGDKVGLIDDNNEIIIEPIWDSVHYYRHKRPDYFLLQLYTFNPRRAALASWEGKILVDENEAFEWFWENDDVRGIQVNKNHKVGLMDDSGQVVVPIEYTSLTDFNGYTFGTKGDLKTNDGKYYKTTGIYINDKWLAVQSPYEGELIRQNPIYDIGTDDLDEGWGIMKFAFFKESPFLDFPGSIFSWIIEDGTNIFNEVYLLNNAVLEIAPDGLKLRDMDSNGIATGINFIITNNFIGRYDENTDELITLFYHNSRSSSKGFKIFDTYDISGDLRKHFESEGNRSSYLISQFEKLCDEYGVKKIPVDSNLRDIFMEPAAKWVASLFKKYAPE